MAQKVHLHIFAYRNIAVLPTNAFVQRITPWSSWVIRVPTVIFLALITWCVGCVRIPSLTCNAVFCYVFLSLVFNSLHCVFTVPTHWNIAELPSDAFVHCITPWSSWIIRISTVIFLVKQYISWIVRGVWIPSLTWYSLFCYTYFAAVLCSYNCGFTFTWWWYFFAFF